MSEVFRPSRIDKFYAQEVGDETLIYDESRHKGFCLNATSAAVWQRCDGTNSPLQISSELTALLGEEMSEELVLFTLVQLQQDGLIKKGTQAVSMPPSKLSRREMVARLGVGAAMALPVVTALLMPETAQALSGGVDQATRATARRRAAAASDPR